MALDLNTEFNGKTGTFDVDGEDTNLDRWLETLGTENGGAGFDDTI